jgi:hypothetical protein
MESSRAGNRHFSGRSFQPRGVAATMLKIIQASLPLSGFQRLKAERPA